LLDALLPTGAYPDRYKSWVSESPFISHSAFMLSHGRRLAVLAVDPSSPVAGGSILRQDQNGGAGARTAALTAFAVEARWAGGADRESMLLRRRPVSMT
jgi:hypothetical protein